MNASITILHVNDTSHIGGFQGSTTCNQALNMARQLASEGQEVILWDDNGDVIHYSAGTAKPRRLDERSIQDYFSAADYRQHVARCVSLERIDALRDEAAEAGDEEQVRLCERAAYDDDARYLCARAVLRADRERGE